jgi:hypothetical protein
MKHTINSLRLRIPFLLVLCLAGATAIVRNVNSEAPRNLKARTATQMFAVGEGPHTFSFQPGRDTQNSYVGAANLQQALGTEQAEPRSLASEDFNGDGMPDLAIGYANKSGGVLSVRRGNLQAIAPDDPAVFQGLTEGRYPSPFLPEATLYALPFAPDFLQVGDFNADGFMDILAAARGGNQLYLMPGDGHGGFKAARQINLLGQVTTMLADDKRQAGRLTAVALGVMAPDGPRVNLYSEARKGLSGEPEAYAMPAEVDALAFGRLDGDGVQDLAAAAGSEVLVIHGRETVAPETLSNSLNDANASERSIAQTPNNIERASFPFMIKGLATGDFIFDRAHQTELALLAEDGTVYLSAHGELDTRAYTDKEKEAIRQQRIAIRRGQQDESTLTTLLNKMIQRSSKSADWNIQEVINTGIEPSYVNASQALLNSARISDLPTDDLLIGDAGSNSVKTLRNTKDAQKLQVKGSETLAATSELKAEGAPLAVLPLRTSVGVKPGMVVLRKGVAEPLITIEVAATYTVDRTDDNAGATACTAAANDCSLRGAVIKSNGNAGADTILLAAGTTYTLTLGPFDDEFNFLGDQETTGDLDIFDSTSITGGNRDTTIINMGTLVPASGGINKDRVLEVNDFLRAQHAYNVTLSNLTIQNGNAPRTPAPDNYNTAGGAIMYDGFESNAGGGPQGTLTLTNCKITANTAAGQGGGITTIDAFLNIQSTSIVSANTCTFAAGGGISYNGGNTAVAQNLQINNSTIGGPLATDGNKANDTTFGIGGGVDAVGSAGATISNGTVIQNNVSGETSGANGGGGLHFGNVPNVAISNTTISNNLAKLHGGGIWSQARQSPPANGPSTIALTTVNIQNNQADSDSTGGATGGDGGGIYNFFGNMTINNTSGGAISGNSANNGGGIYNAWTGNSVDTSASLTMTNGSISTNTARGNGGGFMVAPGAATTFGTISVTGTTINNNTANSDSAGGGDGGGVFVSSGNLNPLSGVTIDSNVANSGTGDGIKLTGGTITGAGTINVNGGDSIDLTGGTFTSTSGTLNLTGNFTNSGATFTHNGGTFNFNGSSAQTIGGSTAMTFNNLTINNSSGVNLGNNETVSSALTLTSGALGVGSNTLTLNGAVTAPGGSLTSNANGTVNYNQSSAGQAILAANYGNLTFSNFAKTLPNGGTVQIRGTFTTGAGGGHTITGSTVEFNGASAQTLPSGFTTYNNLTLNNAAGVTGFAGLTVNGLLRVQQGTFTSSSTYNNVQIDSGATLAGVNATTINVSGNWTNNGTFTANGNTVNFNGSSAQTIGGTSNNNFNNLTINNAAGVNLGGSQTVNGTLTLTNGTLNIGTNTLTLNSTVAFTTGSILSATGGTVNYNQGSNGQAVAPGTYDNLTFSNFNKTLPNGGTVNISGTFTPGTAAGHTITGNTINFNGAGTQTIPAFTYNNLTSSSTGNRTLASSGIIKIAGTFTPGTNAYTITGSTVEYNGAAAQTLPSAFTTYNNLSLNNTAGTTGFAGLTVTGLIEVKAGTFTSSSTYNNVQIDSGATLAATAGSTINVSGSWTNNGGTFTPNTGTVNFNGAATQTIGGTSASTFNNLTDSNSAGLTLGQNETVNGVLALTSSDINTGANTLTMPATGTSTGTFDVIGNVKRTGFVSGGSANTLSFGNPNNQITINSGTVPTDITVNLAKQVPTGTFGGNNFGFPNAVQRTYIITPTGGSSISATLRLHYLDSELNGNTEAGLIFRRFKTVPLPVGWSPIIPTAADTTNNWLEKSGVATFSPWTFNSTAVPTAAPGTISGRVTDASGQPLGGVILQLNGNTNDRTITAADGSYTFENVEVNNFYTVTPQRANFSFNPVNRSFSLVADKTDAVFTATPDAAQTTNPLDMDMYFVRQQYLDFLGREPDHQGLLYWTGELDKCGTDAVCLNNRRVGIAAAFFIEQEYQQTGSYVYRLYKGALGRQLSFNEFNTDRQQVLSGDNLEGNKTAFADAFVQRAEFMQKYNQATGAEGFVDALLNNIRETSGADLGDQRSTLIAKYNGGSDTNQSRALVLREAIENASFKNAEYNPSFVLMEYFGYLKRDPEVDGYKFWLNVLNNKEPNNYRGMVCSFITSTEYQVRFSSVVPHSNQECR